MSACVNSVEVSNQLQYSVYDHIRRKHHRACKIKSSPRKNIPGKTRDKKRNVFGTCCLGFSWSIGRPARWGQRPISRFLHLAWLSEQRAREQTDAVKRTPSRFRKARRVKHLPKWPSLFLSTREERRRGGRDASNHRNVIGTCCLSFVRYVIGRPARWGQRPISRFLQSRLCVVETTTKMRSRQTPSRRLRGPLQKQLVSRPCRNALISRQGGARRDVPNSIDLHILYVATNGSGCARHFRENLLSRTCEYAPSMTEGGGHPAREPHTGAQRLTERHCKVSAYHEGMRVHRVRRSKPAQW